MTKFEKNPKSSPSAHDQDETWQKYIAEIRSGQKQSFQDQLKVFKDIYSNRSAAAGPPFVWQPSEKHIQESNISLFMREEGFADYDEFQKWTSGHRSDFWRKVISDLDIRFGKKPQQILDLSNGVMQPNWLPGAELNCVDSCFKAPSEKTAIISAKEDSAELSKTSYSQLERMVNQVANGLEQAGFEPGDRIALYMPLNVDCVATYLGIIRYGCQVVSIADSFSPAEIKKRLELAATKWIITVSSYRRSGRIINLYAKVREAGDFRAIVISSDSLATENNLELRNGDILWDKFISDKTTFSSRMGTSWTHINILFSSGTTGTPKIIPWTHLTPIKSAGDGRFHQDIHSTDVVAWPTNIGWMMGPWLIFASLINNATMALFEGSPLDVGFIEFVSQARITILGVIPSLVRAWRSKGFPKEGDWDHMHCFSSTGEPSNFEDYLWLISRSGYRAPVIEYLGGTEIGGGHITGSIVKPCYPATFNTAALGLDFILLNEQDKPVNENESGELFLIPPSIGLSQKLVNADHDEIYFKNCPEGPNGEILRRHGDRFMKLPGGFYKAQGRSDDTMNLGGIKVSSIELEQVVAKHKSIQENAAVSVQPAGFGQECLLIFAVLRCRVDITDLKKELNVLLATKLNPLFKIYELVIVDNLPRTASNKLMRRKLRDSYQTNQNLKRVRHDQRKQ